MTYKIMTNFPMHFQVILLTNKNVHNTNQIKYDKNIFNHIEKGKTCLENSITNTTEAI